ncbi:MAG: formylglycine-generating enzyme family protein [Polyangiaceae bacterium]
MALGVTSMTIAASVLFGAKASPAAPSSPGGQGGDASLASDVGEPATSPKNEMQTSLKLSLTPDPAAEDMLENGGPEGPAKCPSGMIDVEGDYCPWVEQKCLRWLDPDTKMRCAEFAPTGACLTKTVRKHFCMDKYEYPNRVGADPIVMKTWYEARATCAGEGKRLCNESEWTLACEGEERLPYPYGYARSSEACNIDKPHPDVDEKALANPKTRVEEAEKLWQGEPSGSREACVSPFGVHDMTGNVDEWVVNESGKPYKSALKGGYWGPVKTRCRPSTVAHAEDFSFYQIGFRCCEDPSDQTSAPSTGVGSKASGNRINAKPATETGPSILAGS